MLQRRALDVHHITGILDARLFEPFFHAAVEFPFHRPASGIRGGIDTLHGDGGCADGRHAPKVEICQDEVSVGLFIPHFLANFHKDGSDLVRIAVDVHRGENHRTGEVTVVVGHLAERAERENVHRPVIGPDMNGAQGEPFDHAIGAVQRYGVADSQGIFQQEENSADEVLHQLLGAETQRHTKDGSTGDERACINSKLGEDRQPDDDSQNQQEQDAEHRCQCLQAGNADLHIPAVLFAQTADMMLDGHIGDLPSQNPDDQSHQNGQGCLEDAGTKRVMAEQDVNRCAPRQSKGQNGQDGHDETDDRRGSRVVTADAEQRLFIEIPAVQCPHEALQPAIGQNADNADSYQRHQGTDEYLEDELVSAINVGCPDKPQGEVEEQGHNPPAAGDQRHDGLEAAVGCTDMLAGMLHPLAGADDHDGEEEVDGQQQELLETAGNSHRHGHGVQHGQQ
ncbi:hypothetical protein SACS_0489 [Parasaccharibacter apium]|uniref:Uncharacterized protein n=1 Tax=Parasaccharibacter apium TaxID=1510841 RepID=A0A7U7G501_9PROT|nr:hypothetical protein SACS_0489 [Parasaccharibacter apium]